MSAGSKSGLRDIHVHLLSQQEHPTNVANGSETFCHKYTESYWSLMARAERCLLMPVRSDSRPLDTVTVKPLPSRPEHLSPALSSAVPDGNQPAVHGYQMKQWCLLTSRYTTRPHPNTRLVHQGKDVAYPRKTHSWAALPGSTATLYKCLADTTL